MRLDAEHLADSGIYSEEDLSRLREHIMFPVESVALLNTFARAAAGHQVPPSAISLTSFLDEETLNKIATSTGKKLWGGFLKFGTASAGFIGIFYCIWGTIISTKSLHNQPTGQSQTKRVFTWIITNPLHQHHLQQFNLYIQA